MSMVTKESFKERLICSLASRWVGKGKIARRAVPHTTLLVLSQLEQLRMLLNSSLRLKLPVVLRDWNPKSLKRFCEEIVESGSVHEWKASLLEHHICRRRRVTVASSLFLFRKVIPKRLTEREKAAQVSAYIDKMCARSPRLESDFDAFCRQEIQRQFPLGWDRKWSLFRDSFTLPTSSCFERSKGQGGVRGGDREELFESYFRFSSGDRVSLNDITEPMMIDTGGKYRIVTRFGENRSFLTPVHKTLYDFLSKKKWLLRGEATHDKFSEFYRVNGEVFVSGDYESATDNLNINLTKLMVNNIRLYSQYIPETVWDETFKCLTNSFPDGRVQRTGQLMGSLMSFPLLCLANYLTFRWAIRREVPVKINGDDIVFRCTPEEKEKWFLEVARSGLKVSKGKTLVLNSAFSLNSTFFLVSGPDVKLCPTIRSTCLFETVDDPNSISGRLKGVYAGGGRVGEQIRSFTLRTLSKQIWSSQRSLRRGLGCVLSWRSIRWAGLFDREVFYSSLPEEAEMPLPKKLWSQNAIPDGWTRSRWVDRDDDGFSQALVQACWINDPRVETKKEKDDEYWARVRDRTFRYKAPPDFKWARMAGMTHREYDAFRKIKPVTHKEKYFWVKKGCGDFVSAE